MALFWLLLACLGLPEWAGAAALKDVEFATLPGNQVRIDLVLSEPLANPRDFSTDSPARIVLDLPGVTTELPRKNVVIDVGPVQSLTALDAEGRTRVVINLTTPVPYRIETVGNRLTIAINEHIPPPSTPGSASPAMTASPGTASKAGPGVRDIDFQRGPGGEGRVQVKLPTENTRVIVAEKGGKVIAEVLDASLPERLRRRLEVVDFGTPVVAIASRPIDRDVEIAIETTKEFEYLAYQVNETFTIEFTPLTPAQQEQKRRDQVTFAGDRLTLNFQDIEVRAVLQLLADFTGLNMVASDSVKGSVTLRLKNVPWDQALDIILKAKDLTMRQKGNVIMVGVTKEVMKSEEDELKFLEDKSKLQPLVTEYIQINYASAAKIAEILNPGQDGGGQAEGEGGKSNLALEGDFDELRANQLSSSMKDSGKGQSKSGRRMLSPRGSVTADYRTNTLLVQDTAEKIEEIRRLVIKLDIPLRQVMIEARVVIATDNFARDLGVRFGFHREQFNENKKEFNEIYGAIKNNSNWFSKYDSPIPLMVNLPVDNPTSGVNLLIGKIGSYLLQLELTAMQKEGRGEVLSNPRVITSDKVPAQIAMGQQIPYQTTSQEGTQTDFKDAELSLTVEPSITPDNKIMMKLRVTKNNADFSIPSAAGPPINTRSLLTEVKVDNGETVVLGGIYERNRSTVKNEVPWLSELPVLGNIFKNSSRSETNEELLIFVTPRIIQEGMNIP